MCLVTPSCHIQCNTDELTRTCCSQSLKLSRTPWEFGPSMATWPLGHYLQRPHCAADISAEKGTGGARCRDDLKSPGHCDGVMSIAVQGCTGCIGYRTHDHETKYCGIALHGAVLQPRCRSMGYRSNTMRNSSKSS